MTARSCGAGTLRESAVGQKVTICGWVDNSRNFGPVVFFTVRDHTGVVQVVAAEEANAAIHDISTKLRSEYCVCIEGTVVKRKDPNPKMPTGQVEITADKVTLLNPVYGLLPFPVSTAEGAEENLREELRLKHRVLDLRRPRMQHNLRLRSKLVRTCRNFLEDRDFLEIETPILTRSTPEGARDYLVPSRLGAGDWYALPQSPQLFKQMLMVSGYDRYYQVRKHIYVYL